MKRGEKINLDDLLVIVPAYNEGSVIRDNLNGILKLFPHVVCINDGSRDNTLSEARKTKAIILDHAINIGQGGAIQTGIEYGLMNGYKFFATMDADGQHSVTDLHEMVKILKGQGGVDIVFGSRFLDKKPENMPYLKKVILKLAILFSNLTSGLKMTDTHNGLRAFNRHAAQSLDLKMSNYSHASEILYRVASKKLSYVEYPTTITYSDYSKQKGQPAINAVNVFVDSILNRFN